MIDEKVVAKQSWLKLTLKQMIVYHHQIKNDIQILLLQWNLALEVQILYTLN